MREGIGSVFLYNIIIVFIVIIFAFLAGTLSYAKAFKVNSRIVNEIEKYEGYNALSEAEISNILTTIGYRTEDDNFISCPFKDGKSALNAAISNHRYCVYEYDEGDNYRSYGIMTFISFELPVIKGVFDIPIYARTVRLYNF